MYGYDSDEKSGSIGRDVPTPVKESVYFALINRAHQLIDRIAQKTEFLRIPNPSGEKKNTEVVSPLERELVGVCDHLSELLHSYRE